MRRSLFVFPAFVATCACVGNIGDGSSAGTADDLPSDVATVPPSGMRRLTVDEYDSTLRDLLFDDSRSSDLLLPKDVLNPFDNDASEQIPSQALIEGANLLAADAAERLLADTSKRDKVVGCTPSGPTDAACFASFVESFGRRALRRPVTDAEIAEYAEFLETPRRPATSTSPWTRRCERSCRSPSSSIASKWGNLSQVHPASSASARGR